jgi:hypothetical protein
VVARLHRDFDYNRYGVSQDPDKQPDMDIEYIWRWTPGHPERRDDDTDKFVTLLIYYVYNHRMCVYFTIFHMV